MRENRNVVERLKNAVGLSELWNEGGQVVPITGAARAKQLGGRAFGNMRAAPLTAALTFATAAIALLLFTIFLLVLENLNQALLETQSALTMRVFLKDGLADDARERLMITLREKPFIESASYRSKEQVREEFARSVGEDSPLVQGLAADNPLPEAFEVVFKPGAEREFDIEALGAQLTQDSAVEHVDYSQGMLTRLSEVIRLIRRLAVGGVIAMLLLTGFVIAIAIRLGLHAHREEIEIMYLVGAMPGFVRAPYMIEGALQGATGGVFSLIVGYLGFAALRSAVGADSPLSAVIGEPQFLSAGGQILVVLLGVLVGIFSSYMAIRRFLIRYR